MDTYLYSTDSELPLENGHAEIEGEGEGGTETVALAYIHS